MSDFPEGSTRWINREQLRGVAIGLLAFCLTVGGTANGATGLPRFHSESAPDYFREVIESVSPLLPEKADFLYRQARLQKRLGRHDEAERLAIDALAADSNRPDLHAFVADLFILQSRLPEARSHLERLLAIQPDYDGAYRRFGMVLDQLGDSSGARQAYEQAIARAPNDALARVLLGRTLLDSGDARAALPHLQRACELDPASANAWYVLSQAQMQLRDHESARESVEQFRKAKQKSGADLQGQDGAENEASIRAVAAELHIELAEMLLTRRRVDAAEVHLRQAAELAPNDPRPYELQAALALRTGKLQEARTVCEALVRLRPDNASYRLNLGAVLLQLKEFPAAVEQLKRCLELDPDQPEALNNLVRFCLGTRRDLPQALEWARRLAKVQPVAANYDLLAWAYFANGNLQAARAASARSIELEPRNEQYKTRYQRLLQLP